MKKCSPGARLIGEKCLYGAKNQRKLSVQSFSQTLRVMEFRAESRGRPHQKVEFPAAP